MALHPRDPQGWPHHVSSLESQGLRKPSISGESWSIHPDGTRWGPLQRVEIGQRTSDSAHFQTQLSDGKIVFNRTTTSTTPAWLTIHVSTQAPDGYPAFGPGYKTTSTTRRCARPIIGDGPGNYIRFPFGPFWNRGADSIRAQGRLASNPRSWQKRIRLGSGCSRTAGAPDNHLLTVLVRRDRS